METLILMLTDKRLVGLLLVGGLDRMETRLYGACQMSSRSRLPLVGGLDRMETYSHFHVVSQLIKSPSCWGTRSYGNGENEPLTTG